MTKRGELPTAVEPTRVHCAADECPRHVADNKWAKIHAIGWFFQRDGTAFCPDHLPEWLASWRDNKDVEH